MSVIYTDLTPAQPEIQLEQILAVAVVGDRIVFQGPNQLDQTWYIVTITKDGIKTLTYFLNLD